jgi:tryptophan synthase alpha chain
MGYYNPLLSFGLREFTVQARDAGLDGLIVADLPPEEADPLKEECRRCDIDLICLLAPTSTDERIAAACAMASGFVYCVSLAGVTGARDSVSPAAFGLVERVRGHTSLPIAVGFGLSRPEHIAAVGEWADAAIVGSALVDAIDNAPEGEVVVQTARFLAGLRREPYFLDRGTP